MTTRAAERTAGRLGLAAAGLLAVVVVLVPLAVLVRRAWPPLVEADLAVTDAAERAVAGSDLLLGVARGATLLGDPTLLWVLAVVLAGVLALRGQRRAALFVLAVRLVTQVVSTGAKAVIDRTRPVFDVPVDTALGASFPSGHALAAAGMWTAVAVVTLPLVPPARRVWLLVLAGVVAALVAASRVLLGVHYLSDVVGGFLLGTGITALCAALLVRWQHEEGMEVDRVTDAVDPGAPR